MEYLQCRIKPKTPFHIGIKEGSLEKTMYYIHSDTIFGGICNAYRLLYGKEELEEMLRKFEEVMPPFLISSAFPYFGDILFFPLPKHINFSKYKKINDSKKYKKIEFVSHSLLRSILEKKFEQHLDGNNIVQEKILLSKNEKDIVGNEKIWKVKETPRVVIDRKSNASNIYYFGEVEYCSKCGLYFLVKVIDKSIENKIKSTIRLLGDEGIGGDRSYGKGSFEAEFKKFEWNINDGVFINLSLYFPKDDEMEMVKNGWYEFVNRGGWVYSIDKKGERKKFVRMIKEGSSFKGDKEFYGGLVDVSVSNEYHKVYRYGYGMPLYLGVLDEI